MADDERVKQMRDMVLHGIQEGLQGRDAAGVIQRMEEELRYWHGVWCRVWRLDVPVVAPGEAPAEGAVAVAAPCLATRPNEIYASTVKEELGLPQEDLVLTPFVRQKLLVRVRKTPHGTLYDRAAYEKNKDQILRQLETQRQRATIRGLGNPAAALRAPAAPTATTPAPTAPPAAPRVDPPDPDADQRS